MLTNLFLSQSRRDSDLIIDFYDRLDVRLRIQKGHDFILWMDRDLRAGEEDDPEIARRYAEADFIIQAISPAFLASDYIRAHEIPGRGTTPLKPTLPFMLVEVSLDKARPVEFFGIDKKQIFRGAWGDECSYDVLTKEYEKNEFVNNFVKHIIDRVNREAAK